MAVVASTESSVRPAVQPRAIVFAGLVALAVAMGIGRFAFTPLLPMMLHDGVVNLPAASWLASANYFGYLVGALLCTFQPWIWARAPWLPTVRHTTWVRGGLVATCLLTAAMAVQWPGVWPTLRFAAGVASAVTFVFTSGWCLARLAALGQPAWAGAIYIGPGAGIAVTGLMVSGMVALDWRAATGWAVFGVLAAALVARVWPIFGGPAPVAAASATTAAAANTPQQRSHAGEKALLALAYGLAGFGYIIVATYLPLMAKSAGSPLLTAHLWSLVGISIIPGCFAWLWAARRWGVLQCLTANLLIQSTCVLMTLASGSLPLLVISSVGFGATFMGTTSLVMPLARQLSVPRNINLLGLVTLTYGIGQILGPLLTSLLGSGAQAIVNATVCGAVALFIAALISLTQLYKQRFASPKRV